MEIPNSFARTLAKLEGRVKKLNMALHNTRHLYELGDQEMTYAVAMRLADTAEQVTLLARALPACTGNPIAAQEAGCYGDQCADRDWIYQRRLV